MTKATILYVEDNEGIAYFVTTALTRAGYNVVRAKDGGQGIVYLRENAEPDIILLDIILPDMQNLREVADEIEMLTGADYWPYPTYGDLLFHV